MSGAVFELKGNQRIAADPGRNVWLSASAGTGKTQVLSARVLRLLLDPSVDPGQVLCLTFTKAGAAEMANRINAVLARWVRLDSGQLGKELRWLGADYGPETQAHARTLFASVLDCPGGGLRIDTIHAFAQYLLANFPEEADLQPGAKPIEDRERELLSREVLGAMLTDAEEAGEHHLIEAVGQFAKAKDPDALRQWLMKAAGAAELWQGANAWQPPMRERVLRLLDMPAGADAGFALEVLDPETFPDGHLVQLAAALREWGKPSGEKALVGIGEWLNTDSANRAEATSWLLGGILNAEGLRNGNLRHAKKFDERFVERQDEVSDAVLLFLERQALLALADFLTSALELGHAFAERWEEAKAREGYLDFDDLIRKAATLLGDKDASAWIRYKLDRDFDHILIDEAQDTNKPQWDIVYALIDDFFAGEGARGAKLRTIFTVGDYKQAIFGFQGTSPDNFERARLKVERAIGDAQAHAHELRDNRPVPQWSDLDLDRSYRTSAPLLSFVNRAIEAIGYGGFGLSKEPAPHEGDKRAGLVTLWNPVLARSAEEEEEERSSNREEERTWLAAHETLLAENIAEQVRRWTMPGSPNYEPYVLEKGGRRHAGPGDVMVLVRRRTTLAAEIVAKLHASGVPVAGVDRLRLGQPLAVQDLMAALRFASQPLDDLSLANLLASPLIGWSQEDLLDHVPRKPKRRLWNHLRASEDGFVKDSVAKLGELLARADFETPQALLAWLTSGPWRARAKLVARLGREANDPIDELINAAFAYQSSSTPSLAGFIEWFDASTSDLKRDPDEATGQIRVMTVHGSKGLQAPIVILADAASEPGRVRDLSLADDPVGSEGEDARKVPLPSLSSKERVGPVADAAESAQMSEMQEHWRLLYVAMTRAEEALFIGGSLGKKKTEPPEDSWFKRLEPLFDDMRIVDDLWGARRELGIHAKPLSSAEMGSEGAEEALPNLPDWALQPIGEEPRPPKPLAPSSAGEEQGSDPPLPPKDAGIAARRGTLIHRLLERLPDIAADQREETGEAWLERQAGDLPQADREEMLTSALKVIQQPGFEAIFSPDALAEVPLAATVDGVVVAGTADRLLIDENSVSVVDFKTTRRPPQRLEDIPAATVRQMAAYARALAAIYPGREINALVLYTHSPALFVLPPAILTGQKINLTETQDNYAPGPIE